MLTLQVCKSTSLQVCKSASLQVCKSASLQVCKSASLQVCKSASLQVCKSAVCKSASLQVCSLQVSHTAPRASTSEREQLNYSASIFLGLQTEHVLKPVNFTTYYHQIIRFIGSFVQSVAPRKYLQNNLFVRVQIRFLLWEKNPDKRLHGFEGVFNASVLSVPAVHIESKMIIFYE